MEKQGRMYLAELLGTFCLVFIGTSVATLQGFIPGHDGTGWLEISAASYRRAHRIASYRACS